MNNKKKAAIAVAVVLLLAVGAWGLGLFGMDPEVAALDKQRQVVFSGEATDEQRQEFRDRVGQLTDDQRRQLFERGRPDMKRMMADRMNELFNQPPDELRKTVNEKVEDILTGRAEREDGARGGGGRGGWGKMSEAQRDERRKKMLDMVEPSTRAQFSEFRRMIDTELEARGEDPISGRDFRSLFGGRGGRGGGRGKS